MDTDDRLAQIEGRLEEATPSREMLAGIDWWLGLTDKQTDLTGARNHVRRLRDFIEAQASELSAAIARGDAMEARVEAAKKVLESQADLIGTYDWEDSSSEAVLEAFLILRSDAAASPETDE